MLESLVTSKTRVKLLLKFFLNQDTQAYLRELAEEFGESTNAVRVELNRLTEAGFLTVRDDGRTKLYQANPSHPLFPELHSLVKKYLGIDQLIDRVLSRLGSVKLAFITGDYASGKDSGIIDLTIVGKIDRNYLNELIEKTERMIHRKIRVLVLNEEEFERLKHQFSKKSLIIWGDAPTAPDDGVSQNGVQKAKATAEQ
ncbi:MAG: winged helix-turn-helix domain-containing protein [Chloroherpetonaceae bacterium]|nr:winged helix-turn-helix domain-containing protein [Chloroherpetonaceae bacterium]